MRYCVAPEIECITLQDTAELIIASRQVTLAQGRDHYLVRHLHKLVGIACREEFQATTFEGEELHLIISALHHCSLQEEDSWERAQANSMLRNAI